MVYPFLTKNLLLSLMIIIFKITSITNDYISIPFKKYKIMKNMQSSTDIFINNYLNNNIYMNMQISQPSQNIIAKINSLEFELLMKNTNKLPFENMNSSFSKEASSTFSIISEKEGSHFPNSKFVKDNFCFCVNYDINSKSCSSVKNYPNINFIYSEENETDEEIEGEGEKTSKKWSYMEIGLNYKSYYNSNKNKDSLLSNLIRNNYISNQNWFISFFNENKNNNDENEINFEEKDDGIIVFGIDPAKFYDIENNEDNVVSCPGINLNYDYQNTWSII